MKQLEFGVLQKFFWIGALGEQFDSAAKPCVGARFAHQLLCRRAEAVFIERVRGDAIFRNLIHVEGTDLQLDALLARPDHGGVDRAVVVLLGRGGVILEPARHHRPGRVNYPERLVALGNGLYDHTEAEDVRELLETH